MQAIIHKIAAKVHVRQTSAKRSGFAIVVFKRSNRFLAERHAGDERLLDLSALRMMANRATGIQSGLAMRAVTLRQV